MSYPKISVITPSYNQGQYLEETILSVVQQEYPNIEYIIIDGGSQDNSIDIIRKYEHRLAYWISEPDRGQSHALNKGLAKATGEIISFIMSDDLLVKGALAQAADLFQKSGDEVSVLHGGTVIFNHQKDIKIDFGYPQPSMERYLSGLSFSHTASFIRKKYLDIVGYYNENCHYGMDYELYSRLLLVSEFRKVDRVFSRYRLHSGSKSVALEKKFVEEWIAAFVNVVFNLEFSWIENEMRKLKVFDAYLEMPQKFDFAFDQKKFNQQWVLFYFLSDVFKADYRTANFSRAKRIGKYIRQNYSSIGDAELKLMLNRLRYFPGFFISSWRDIGNGIKRLYE